MVLKIQVPLASNQENPPCLVYDQTRKFRTFVPLTSEIKRLLKGDPKGYFEAKIQPGTGEFEIIKRVSPQQW